MALSQAQFIIDLFLLLAGSVIAGEVASRFGQPALVGQLLVGVVLGPTLIGPYLGLATLDPSFSSLQFLATVFILFMAGLEIVPEEIYRMGLLTALLGIAIFVFPFFMGFLAVTALYPGISIFKAFFIALTLSITALPVMGIMLVQFNLLDRPFGRFLMNTALINELTAVTVFAILLQLSNGHASGVHAVSLAMGEIGLFLGVMLGLHLLIRYLAKGRLWARFQARFAENWRSKGAGFAILMVLVIGASLFSQYLGLTFVVGAFYAGLLVTRESAGIEAHKSISTVFDTITWGFFIPLFFALVGLQMNLRDLGSLFALGAFVALLLVAIFSKVGIGLFSGWARGWSRPDALAVGFLVSSRGAVELAMAVILLQLGIFGTQLFTIVAAVGLITTMLAPIGALWSWRQTERSREELYERVPDLRRPGPAAWIRTPALTWGDVRDVHIDPNAAPPGRTPLPSRPTALSDPPPAGAVLDRPPLPRPRKPPDS